VVVDGRALWPGEAVRAAGLVHLGVGVPGETDPVPARKPIPVAKPVLGGEAAEAAARAIRSGWIVQGPQVAAFEREFAEYTGAPHAVAVSNGTAALHLALMALGIRPVGAR